TPATGRTAPRAAMAAWAGAPALALGATLGLAATATVLPPPPLDAEGAVRWFDRLGPTLAVAALVRVLVLAALVRLALAVGLAGAARITGLPALGELAARCAGAWA